MRKTCYGISFKRMKRVYYHIAVRYASLFFKKKLKKKKQIRFCLLRDMYHHDYLPLSVLV